MCFERGSGFSWWIYNRPRGQLLKSTPSTPIPFKGCLFSVFTNWKTFVWSNNLLTRHSCQLPPPIILANFKSFFLQSIWEPLPDLYSENLFAQFHVHLRRDAYTAWYVTSYKSVSAKTLYFAALEPPLPFLCTSLTRVNKSLPLPIRNVTDSVSRYFRSRPESTTQDWELNCSLCCKFYSLLPTERYSFPWL